jgi:DNA helicase-2/ATP-dependent DNA helicase PcrA
LILAGAGSGKTRVLTTRIAWLLQTGQVSPGGILAVTFTNKAAKEMMTRLTAMLPLNVRGMWIGTFHGLCNRFLRAHYKLANLPQAFQILDTQDQLSAIKRLMKQFNIDDERFPPKQTQYFISGNKEDGLRAHGVEARDDANAQEGRDLPALRRPVPARRRGGFGELMLRSYELLRDNDPIREHYQRRFRHILIDEFQDTNKLQYAWIKLIAGQGEAAADHAPSAVLAVGDDDQSIYAFRGARVGNMADFVREFDVQHQIKLEQNYRSFSNILDSANELISHNKQTPGQEPAHRPGSRRAGAGVRGDQRLCRGAVDGRRDAPAGQGRWPAAPGNRRALPQQRPEPGDRDGAVQRRHAVPRVRRLRFFERAEIKHALAYLRLLENKNDDTSFLRVVNFPPRGIGARSLEQLQDVARDTGCSLHDAVSAVPGKAGANLGAFVAKIDVLREQTRPDPARDHRTGAGPQRPDRALPAGPRRCRPHREP